MTRVHILVLNHNGRRLLEECLPSVVVAAQASSHQCSVAVIDNASSDDSVGWLQARYPQVEIIRLPNRGLCSFNAVVPALEGPVAVLLNNDVKVDRHTIDPLVAPLIEKPQETGPPCFMTAPRCWRFDGGYEGFRTAVCWRWGLVQATALYPGHAAAIGQPGLTASAGAAMAVDRDKFAALGGFDPLYLPGRLEDLDLAFRAYLAGYRAVYVPEALVWHLGMATFGPVFGPSGCVQLALRNTLLFQWKNLRHPAHLARQVVGLPLRLLADLVRAPSLPKERRWAFARALAAAVRRRREEGTGHRGDKEIIPEGHAGARGAGGWEVGNAVSGRSGGACPATVVRALAAEREFFRRFHPRHMRASVETVRSAACLRARNARPQTTPAGALRPGA